MDMTKASWSSPSTRCAMRCTSWAVAGRRSPLSRSIVKGQSDPGPKKTLPSSSGMLNSPSRLCMGMREGAEAMAFITMVSGILMRPPDSCAPASSSKSRPASLFISIPVRARMSRLESWTAWICASDNMRMAGFTVSIGACSIMEGSPLLLWRQTPPDLLSRPGVPVSRHGCRTPAIPRPV